MNRNRKKRRKMETGLKCVTHMFAYDYWNE